MRIKDDNEIKNILKIISPGTNLREGLENILRAKTGGLIVFGDSEEVMSIVDGGFTINAEYTPAYIYELAKMDGAIVLSQDLRKIVCANAQLLPDPTVPTYETGTRHRTAQRIAKQTDTIVVAISQRRNIITVYKGDIKYVLQDSSVILARANQAIQTLEKYVNVLERVINNLNILDEVNKGATMGMNAIKMVGDKTHDADLKSTLKTEYEKYNKISERIHNLYSQITTDKEPHEVNKMEKMMTWYGIQMRTITDDTPSKLSELLMQGTNMGIIEGRRLLNHNQNTRVDESVKNILNDFVAMQEDSVETLKKFL